MEKPVTKPDKEDVIPWNHHKPERRVFKKDTVRNHMRYMARRILNRVIPGKILPPIEETVCTLESLDIISQHKSLKDFVEPILFENLRKDYLELCAEFLHSLSGDDFIATIIPPRCIPLLQEIFSKIECNENCSQELGKMHKYNPHIPDLFWIASDTGKVDQLINLFMYFIERVESVHYKNPNPTEVNEIPNSYDPRRGTAYYFTEKGNQLRQMPTYKADIELEKKKK